MKHIFIITLLTLLSLNVSAQIQVEEKPKTATPSSTNVTPFDSTRNSAVYGTDISQYIGRELFFLDKGGEFFSDSLAEKSLFVKPQLKYYIFLDRVYVPSRTYYDSYRQDIVETKSKFLYKLQEKGTDNIIWFNPDLDNPFMPRDNAFTVFDVIWVSYYNYLKTEYIGKKYALTRGSFSDYNTGETITYKYNDIWTIEDVKVIKDDGLGYKESYVLRFALKNNAGNVITLSPKSTLLVDKKTYDGYIKLYGAAMVKAAFEGELKVGMHKSLVNYAIKQYLNANRDNLSVSNTSKGEEWTIRSSSKTRYINFNTAGKVVSWKEEDTQTLRMTGKVSVSPR
ncbi:MAG: hypothetical protein K6A67_10695 [Bacteroidales bacterium]|nr:hypothetical protein [Bacteroidales bacterium]